jgi:hypothetical protein
MKDRGSTARRYRSAAASGIDQTNRRKPAMGALVSFLYGFVVYALFLATFLYAIAFTGNVIVPKSIDSIAPAGSVAEALNVNPIAVIAAL